MVGVSGGGHSFGVIDLGPLRTYGMKCNIYILELARIIIIIISTYVEVQVIKNTIRHK